MPIVPYHHGGGQVPLQTFLPSPSRSYSTSVVLPDHYPTTLRSIPNPEYSSIPAQDASTPPIPTIDVLVTSPSSPKERFGEADSTRTCIGCACSSRVQMKTHKGLLSVLGTFLGLFTFSGIYQNVLFHKITPISERQEESTWVASSDSWLDRRICNWFGVCGVTHLNKSGWTQAQSRSKSRNQLAVVGESNNLTFNDFWSSGKTNPEEWSEYERELRKIPDYVLEYAPYVHLYSGEEFWPCDIADHLVHTTPHLNYTPLQASSDHPNLTNLNELNEWGRFVYLQSDDNVEERPEWLGGETNIPTEPEEWNHSDGISMGARNEKDIEDSASGENAADPLYQSNKHEGLLGTKSGPRGESDKRSAGVRGGRSDAPAVLILVDKGEGVVDAFWFFFYSYNLGNKVFNVRFGNHVGDWEHTVVRFHHGKPKEVWFSEHNFGLTYTYEAVEKIGKRPVAYSATGTHAMYGTPGTHPYVLPGGILHDETDRGPLWDPLLNVHSFTYDYVNDTLRSSALTPFAPIEWFYFMGHWGDKFYPLNDPRQYRFLGQYHYVNGPLGPRFKNLGRKNLCPDTSTCEVKDYLGPSRAHRRRPYTDVGEGEEMREEDVRRFVGP